ncbi:unnamed protein product [Musa acuminata subsp. malaccensis]|uniref:(wild Malaysian banana) hypothetical protein n=1 Tax=Musa acuminata subsp. malaccensis TaxID=214687 RepID=A0A804IZC6_MUSAM|nr:unnamed protein product [Musa acuminata subsp. malaccensis]
MSALFLLQISKLDSSKRWVFGAENWCQILPRLQTVPFRHGPQPGKLLPETQIMPSFGVDLVASLLG